MTIHDELICELIKKREFEKPAGEIIRIVGNANIKYSLEELFSHSNTLVQSIAPDIVVEDLSSKELKIDNRRIAVEMETDLDWDFGHSLRQVKNYRSSKLFKDVVVIIPKEYERFTPYYKNEGFKVWLWDATRRWKCNLCETEFDDRRSIRILPKCGQKKCTSRDLKLIGLKDASFTEA